jgi:signal transduction histidine kinase
VLSEKRSDGTLIRAGDRSIYFPIDFSISKSSTTNALGFDLGSIPAREETLRRACDTGRMAATAWTSYATVRSNDPIVAFYLPIFQPDLPQSTPAERRIALKGYVAAVILLSDLMSDALADQQRALIEFRISDDVTPVAQRQVLSSDGSIKPWLDQHVVPDPASLSAIRTLDVGGHPWTATAQPTGKYYRVNHFQQSQFVLLGGGLFTCILTAWLLTLVGRASQVEKLVAQRTDQLAEVNRQLNTEVGLRAASEHALQEQNAELAYANEAKDRFLATMSHELRTPLNAIIGFTGTLLMRLPGPLNDAQQQQLETIQASSRYLLSLINDLLDLAKIESGKVHVSLEPVSCRAIIEEVVTALRPLADIKGLGLEIAPIGEDLTASTDRRALSQIVINLVNNAIKYTDHGEVVVTLTRRAGIAGRAMAEISVRDTGCGIKAEDQARLFQAFSQLDTSSTRRHEGAGLGLHLSQKIATLLTGHIAFSSEPGKGSTFSIWVPIQEANK